MFEAFFSDPDLTYRINVINSIDFYSLGFEMVRGETKAENMLQWLRKGEVADVLVTKPSELAFYPDPKLFIRRVGGHEQWGAIHSAEIGDGTLECRDIPHTLQMIKLFMNDDKLLCDMCDNIEANKKAGIYNGAYEAVKIAMNMKKE